MWTSNTIFTQFSLTITSSQQCQFFSNLVVVRDEDEYEYVDGPRLTPLGGCSVSCGGGTQLISCTGTVRECKKCNYLFKSLFMFQRRFVGWSLHGLIRPFQWIFILMYILNLSSLFFFPCAWFVSAPSKMTFITIKKCKLPNVTSLLFQNLFAA